MNERTPRRLDQLGTVARGKSRHRPRNDPALYGGPWPFFQTGDVKAAQLYLRTFSQTYNDIGLAQSKLWPAGTLCITIAANIADTAILGIPGCFPDSVVGFIADPTKSDVRFIKYYIETLKQGMQNASRGTTQDNLSVDKLLTFEFLMPSAQRQRDIASILSAYDELIENNTRRIAILEDMARHIYEEWFVRYRFPGHEDVKMVESEFGPRPIAWISSSILDVCSFVKGIEPGRSAYSEACGEGMVPFLRVGDLAKRSGELFVDRSLAKGNELVEEDIAISLDGTVGVVRYGLRGAYSGGIRKVVPIDEHFGRAFLYQYLRSDYAQGVIRAHANGATILHAGSSIRQLRVAMPPRETLRAFEELAQPMMRQVILLGRANAGLRMTRDLLLPKLVSGETGVFSTGELEALAA